MLSEEHHSPLLGSDYQALVDVQCMLVACHALMTASLSAEPVQSYVVASLDYCSCLGNRITALELPGF